MNTRVRHLADPTEAEIAQLSEVLIDCVEGGASVSFMLPLSSEKAHAFWGGVAADVRSGKRILLVADDESGIAGTAQIALDMPENQPHR